MAKRICVIEGCENYRAGRGWCAKHWRRWSIHGDPLGGKPGQAFTKALDHPDGTRTCSQCAERKPIEQFDKVQNATLGRRSNCKACRSTQMKARYEADREAFVDKEKSRRAQRRAAKIAVDPEHYARLEVERAWQSEVRKRVDSVGYRRYRRITERRRDVGLNRKNLRVQYGDSCFYCSVEMDFTPLSKTDKRPRDLATLEHIIPIALGGTHTWDNVVLACYACNCAKNRTPLAVWIKRQAAPT